MKLKPVLDTLEGLSDALKELYTQRSDGKFALDLDGEPVGFVAKGKLDEFRNNNVELMKQLEALKGKSLSDEDLAEFTKLREEQQKMKDKQLIDAGKIDELLATRTEQMRKDFEAKYGALDKKYTETAEQYAQTQTRLSSVLIDAELSKTITQVGQIRKGALTDIMLRAKTAWQYKDGQLVAVDGEGQPVYSKDGKSPMSMTEWCQGLAESAPYLFEGNQGGGAQGNNGGQGGSKAISKGDSRGFISNLEGIAKGTVVVSDRG